MLQRRRQARSIVSRHPRRCYGTLVAVMAGPHLSFIFFKYIIPPWVWYSSFWPNFMALDEGTIGMKGSIIKQMARPSCGPVNREGTNKSDVNSDIHHVIQTLINIIDIRGNAVTSFDVVQSKKNKIKRHHWNQRCTSSDHNNPFSPAVRQRSGSGSYMYMSGVHIEAYLTYTHLSRCSYSWSLQQPLVERTPGCPRGLSDERQTHQVLLEIHTMPQQSLRWSIERCLWLRHQRTQVNGVVHSRHQLIPVHAAHLHTSLKLRHVAWRSVQGQGSCTWSEHGTWHQRCLGWDPLRLHFRPANFFWAMCSSMLHKCFMRRWPC